VDDKDRLRGHLALQQLADHPAELRAVIVTRRRPRLHVLGNEVVVAVRRPLLKRSTLRGDREILLGLFLG